MTSRRVARGLVLALLCAAGLAGAQQRVNFDSLDRDTAGAPVHLTGDWFAAGSARAPAVVLLHGCGGAYDRSGRLSARMRGYVALLNAEGWHALVLDSLGPRGERELCTQRAGTRKVTMANRRLDAFAAVDWLARRADVAADRIGLIGWSNGGSTVLAATNLVHPAVAQAPRRPAFAVAFYPGCETDLKRGYRAAAPLLLMSGEADDWTPAEPCRQLAAKAGGAPVRFEAFAGAYHGFDGEAPLRLRQDVPNGAFPGQGVHVGGDAAARTRSRELLIEFLRQHR